MSQPKLYMMIGLAGSGKTTLANKIAESEDAVIVSSDAIREQLYGTVKDQSHNADVFGLYHKRIRDYLKLGRNVIADATSITYRTRKQTFLKLYNIPCKVIGVVVASEMGQCLKQNDDRQWSDDDATVEKYVDEDVIYAQRAKFQMPFMEEGFDEIVLYKDTDNVGYVGLHHRVIGAEWYWEDVVMRMLDHYQHTPYHNDILYQHCSQTMAYFVEHNPNIDSKYKLAALFHDMGKLETMTMEIKDEEAYNEDTDTGWVAHYLNHANVGAYEFLTHIPRVFVNNLQLMPDILDVVFLINYHMMPFDWNTEKSQEKWKKIFGEDKYNLLMAFHEADCYRPVKESE